MSSSLAIEPIVETLKEEPRRNGLNILFYALCEVNNKEIHYTFFVFLRIV